ncbi:MAG: hypothetical protein GOMPHAMPRED_004192 [Gomphillus americanus]|uniref:Uncharacterized protein n=1 Tax=Gomphillus americanus TaxID=1940652 RepID=A0A8H3FRQ3_9LECA|nr:MAG: hypothetical protein GOMPHAMPRED_004192 [Gomphillus americanus]
MPSQACLPEEITDSLSSLLDDENWGVSSRTAELLERQERLSTRTQKALLMSLCQYPGDTDFAFRVLTGVKLPPEGFEALMRRMNDRALVRDWVRSGSREYGFYEDTGPDDCAVAILRHQKHLGEKEIAILLRIAIDNSDNRHRSAALILVNHIMTKRIPLAAGVTLLNQVEPVACRIMLEDLVEDDCLYEMLPQLTQQSDGCLYVWRRDSLFKVELDTEQQVNIAATFKDVKDLLISKGRKELEELGLVIGSFRCSG